MPRSLGLLFQNLLGSRPAVQPLYPSSVVGIIFLHLFQARVSSKKPRYHGIPRNEGEICISTLVADKVFLALESLVQHAVDAYDLLLVALDGGLQLLMVEVCEPVDKINRC